MKTLRDYEVSDALKCMVELTILNDVIEEIDFKTMCKESLKSCLNSCNGNIEDAYVKSIMGFNEIRIYAAQLKMELDRVRELSNPM